MGSKHKPPARTTPVAGQPPRTEIDRLIAKRWYKDAVKQAKICHRDHPSPEHHRLLEQAYYLRAKELLDGGMRNAAEEVAGHLLDFGITDPSLNEPVATLLIAVGLERQALQLQGKLDDPEALERLNRQAADQLVLHPERKSGSSPEIAEGASTIRAALEALEQGDEPRAMEALRGLSRTSPFADWRLFVRGLAAFRRGDDGDARANWERLDPSRSASRIARPLIEVMGTGLLQGTTSPKVDGLERWALSEPILGPLREAAGFVARGEWPEAIRKLGQVRLAIRRVEPKLALRLTEALYAPLLHEVSELPFDEASTLLKAFTKAAEPLPIDPRWNRLWALAWDGPQGHPEEAEPYWKKYADDLDLSTAIRPEERPKARALILAHLGRQWAELALDLDEKPPLPGYENHVGSRKRAIACLEESLKLFPTRRETYQALIEVFEDADQPDRAAEAASRLLEAIPDDTDTLLYLARYHYFRDQPAQALEFTLKVRKLKPLDPEIVVDEVNARIKLARLHARQNRFDEARGEMETARKLQPELTRSAHFQARLAALEIKAGRPEVARAILDQANKDSPDAAALPLVMAIEARRFELSKTEIHLWEARWAEAITGKVRGEAAGAFAGTLSNFLNDEIDYPGRDEHVKQLTAYLARTTRIKYDYNDLGLVCNFLARDSEQRDLFTKLVNRGVKLFPKAPEFPMYVGMLEMEKGPFRADVWKARDHLEKAMMLAKAGDLNDPRTAQLLPEIQKIIDALNKLTASPFGMSFPFQGFPDEIDDFDLPELDFADDGEPRPFPRRKGRKS